MLFLLLVVENSSSSTSVKRIIDGKRNVISAMPNDPTRPCKSSNTSPLLAKKMAATSVCVKRKNARKKRRKVNAVTLKRGCFLLK